MYGICVSQGVPSDVQDPEFLDNIWYDVALRDRDIRNLNTEITSSVEFERDIKLLSSKDKSEWCKPRGQHWIAISQKFNIVADSHNESASNISMRYCDFVHISPKGNLDQDAQNILQSEANNLKHMRSRILEQVKTHNQKYHSN